MKYLPSQNPLGGSLLHHVSQMNYFLCKQHLVVSTLAELALFSAWYNFKAFLVQATFEHVMAAVLVC